MNTTKAPGLSVWQVLQNEIDGFNANLIHLDGFVRSIGQTDDLGLSLAHLLAHQLAGPVADMPSLRHVFEGVYENQPTLIASAARDLVSIDARDPAAGGLLRPFLFFKGYHAIQTYRVANALWHKGQRDMALFLQNRSSVVFAVDIHPAARLGAGLMMDHATGVVIGETAVVEDDVSMLHAVTLGGTGNEQGDRHPKIGRGVMIGAGAKILGNIRVGEGACIAAGSVVLKDVPAHVTVAGVPAQIIGTPRDAVPSEAMNQLVVD